MLSMMWALDLKIWDWFHFLLVKSKLFPLWKSMINNLYFLCFWDATTSFTLWQNLDLRQICKLLMFKRFQMVVKDIKCCLEWWAKHEFLFPTVAFLARQILDIVGSWIEIERIISLVGILTNLRWCHLQLNISDKIIFVINNWPSDPRVCCSSPSSLIKLIEANLALEEEYW